MGSYKIGKLVSEKLISEKLISEKEPEHCLEFKSAFIQAFVQCRRSINVCAAQIPRLRWTNASVKAL